MPIRRLLLALFALGLAPAAQAVAPQGDAWPRYVPGEIIVKYRKGVDDAAIGWSALKLGAVEQSRYKPGRLVTLKLIAGLSVEDAVARLEASGEIEYAHPNWYRWRHAPCANSATQFCPDDTDFGLQFALHNAFLHTNGQESDSDMDLPEAWRFMIDTDGAANADAVRIAIIDDGFNVAHTDLADNITGSISCASDPCSGSGASQSTDEDHGTLVAGSAGAVGNNASGVASPVLSGNLYLVRLGLSGGGFTTASVTRGIDAAIAAGAKIINLSLGGSAISQSEFDAVSRAEAAGILVVASAGNSDSNADLSVAHYPSNFDLPNVLSVGASDANDNMVSFSIWGPTKVDIAAAGSTVRTTTLGGGTGAASGTSFSSPLVAGVAALVGQHIVNGGTPLANLDYRELRARLLAGADTVSDNGTLGLVGRIATGRANARKSLDPVTGGVLVVQDLAFDDNAGLSAANDGDGLPDPGETFNLQVTLKNDWQAAGTVAATLSSTSGAVAIGGGGAANYPAIAAFGTGSASFPVTLSEFTDIRQILFRLDLTPTTGAAQTRYFYIEVGELANGELLSQAIQRDDWDEFHGWHVNVPTGATNFLVETETDGSIDIDLLARRNARPEYLIDIGVNPDNPNRSFDVYPTSGPDAALVSGEADGAELIGSPSRPATDVSDANTPGTWHLVVVNFAQSPHTYRIRASWDAAGAGTIRFNGESATVAETAGNIAIQVVRSGGTGAASVNYATADGSATAGTDYTATTGTLNWANGDTAAKTITIPVLTDSETEGTETFALTLSSPSGGADLGRFRTTTVSLTNSTTTTPPPSGGGGGGGPFDPLSLFWASLGVALLRRRKTHG